jgi:hypothetical protein
MDECRCSTMDGRPTRRVDRSGTLASTSQPSRGSQMPSSSPRNLLPIVAAYLPVAIGGAALSVLWDVGATPEGGASDMFLRGTALTPPLFLPVVLAVAAAAARADGRRGRVGAGFVTLVAIAFMAGSTANLPNDVAAARAAGTPIALTAGLAAIHLGLSVGLLYNALPRLRQRAAADAGDLKRQPA